MYIKLRYLKPAKQFDVGPRLLRRIIIPRFKGSVHYCKCSHAQKLFSLLYWVTIVSYTEFCTWGTMLNVFSPYLYSHLHRQLSDNFIPSKTCQIMGRMSIKKRGRAPGLIENKASLRLFRKLSKILIGFD